MTKQDNARDHISLSPQQYNEIMREIARNHRWCFPPKDESKEDCHKYIKYVRSNWDMRDGMCFSIRFDPMDKHFGSGSDESEPMYDRIMHWLNTPREGTE